ncbi:GNAT family N-acetyltransferase [Nocardioides sp. dk4132]|uniref:GNAT family N-acetyltransferase n=1 Tax=unclassified Nocardioides TaxID=2615069 RepID=UPI001296F9B1|nr:MULTISPECIES: GNAT family N-acetyltransferase [unclassified Nocardioides]MQW76008.1 GNAT family N-acetyltransferase [Nocardioides sp. dk4132]QGA08861.1 GNAT family N-acetyltransferase [Nocardioides sp. dk884]
MLWRVRTRLPDRPGALAALARACGDAEVNILSLQIFPDLGSVTDELVLRTPQGWGPARVAGLLEGAGGTMLSCAACGEAALVDQPTRYVQAARTVLAEPASFPEVVARLFDAEPDTGADADSADARHQDLLEVSVGGVQVQLRRTAPFTATEHARAASMADLVSDVLQHTHAPGDRTGLPARRLGGGRGPRYVVQADAVSAVRDGLVVGLATLGPASPGQPDARPVSLRVDPAWQRCGIGTRLLVESARLARAQGAAAIVFSTRSDNRAVLPMVLAAGLRGRIRMTADVLTVRVPVRDLTPLR